MKRILKAGLKRKGVTYGQLVDELAAIGVKETEPNIHNEAGAGQVCGGIAVPVFYCYRK